MKTCAKILKRSHPLFVVCHTDMKVFSSGLSVSYSVAPRYLPQHVALCCSDARIYKLNFHALPVS